jgi:MFS family permease
VLSGRFLRRSGHALGFGFLLTFSSSIGQTYFISLFAGAWRAELGLSHGAFGGLYALATMASAALLVWIGKSADRFDPARLSLVTLALLAGSALLVAQAESLFWLTIGLFGLRLGGQGMLSHLAMTSMARWFARERGRALGIAMLGYPAGEALFPFLLSLLLSLFAWRQIWVGIALVVVAALMPAVLWLGRQVRRRGQGPLDPQPSSPANGRQGASWTRAQVLRDARFYALLPGLLAPPFIITGVLFHQVHLVGVKGWTLAGFTACYPLYAASAMAVALGAGWLVDRFGVARILPFYLLPLALGSALLGGGDAFASAAAFMALMGATAGGATIVLGAIWPELYGTGHLGAIRALAVALTVLATAMAPGIMGWLIDQGVRIEVQLTLFALYLSACALGLALLLPALRRQRVPPERAPRSPRA